MICETTWLSSKPTLIDEPNRYRQHRCAGGCDGRDHVCRYCRTTLTRVTEQTAGGAR